MRQEFNFIKSNTDDREESSWFVLLFLNLIYYKYMVRIKRLVLCDMSGTQLISYIVLKRTPKSGHVALKHLSNMM